MRQPAYQLRPNKAIDRLTLVDAIRRLGKLEDLSEYVYYSMGGPTLEDFRMVYEFYPEIRMVSIEENEQVFKRQRFNAPCHSSRLKLWKGSFKSFLAQHAPEDQKGIYWLDYQGLEYGNLADFMGLLGKIPANSVIKITLRCHPPDYSQDQQRDEFTKKFELLLPHASAAPAATFDRFATLIQEMVQIASEKALPSAMPMTFLPLCSFYYNDGAGMFTLTGIVCLRSEKRTIRNLYENWAFANTSWLKPTPIDVPLLSTKERLRLQNRLPCNQRKAGKTLRRALGYLIDADTMKTDARLQQYAQFHRHFPYFMKAVP